jgi:GNAT superfamily N-acetyltransferase
MLEIVNTRDEHAEACAALQAAVFPTLAPEEWFSADQYRKHIEVFPDGQFVALWDGVVVGATSTFRTYESFEDSNPPYYFDFIGGGWFTTHDPHGEWLYGVDVSVHPDFRRRGIASRLYDARRALVKRLNLRGEVVAALMPGYADYQGQLSAEDYLAKVGRGELIDPTVSAQMANGFTVKRVLRGFITDARSDNTAALIVRPNRNGQLIRPAHPDEAPMLTALFWRSKAYWGFGESIMERIREAAHVSREHIEQSAAVNVLEIDGRVIGFYQLKVIPDGLWLEDLFLEPDTIGKGYGKLLWDHAVETGRKLGYSAFDFEAEPFAEGFYARMGAVRTATRYSPITSRDMPLMRYEFPAR